MAKKRVRKPTITQQIMQPALEKLLKYQHDVTRKTYTRQMKLFVKFCRAQFNSRSFEDCRNHIQEYSNYLQKENYSASTIHTYLAAVCAVFDVNLSTISKPVRHVANYKKGRNERLIDAKNDMNNPGWSHIIEFQKRVGIRRDELKRLCGNDFTYDESGHPCVLVQKGKGGKRQLQRISEKDLEFIKSYFDSVFPNERVFDEKYFQNDLNFHRLRAECAKEYYYEQLKMLKENPSYRAQLEQEIKLRWNTTNKKKNGKTKPFRYEEMFGVYTLRGKNRILAKEKGLPLSYDKTALLATSLFKLSHFRNDVTVASYLLA